MAGPFPYIIDNLGGVQSASVLDQMFDVTTPSVANYAALRLFDVVVPEVVCLVGGLTFDDGNQGLFAYDASDVTSPDNGDTIIVTVGGQRWKRLSRGGNTPDTIFAPTGAALTLTQAGTYTFTGSTPRTWLLPTVASGTTALRFKNRASVNLTLQRQGGDQIYASAPVSSLIMLPGQGLFMFNDATYWNVA